MSKKWLLAALLVATPAVAHDWYPLECCHHMDCAAVDKVEMLPTPAVAGAPGMSVSPGAMMVTTKHGSVLVPANFPRRESKDHRMHACMMPGEGGKMRLICIFMPPSTCGAKVRRFLRTRASSVGWPAFCRTATLLRWSDTELAMAPDLEDAVARHYGVPELDDRIARALAAAGLDADRLKPEDLAPIDEFHIGGRQATMHAVGRMGLEATDHVLDIGCGIGGATRYIAETAGCRVTGIDLTPGYIAAAQNLARRTGLADRISYQVGSALDMPFADRSFDAAITLHVAMNIAERAGLYREAARVLKPGAVFCIYDVMQGEKDGLKYPVPWADTPATSHLRTPLEMHSLLGAAGFEAVESEDRTAYGLAFFRERLTAAASGPPPLGLHIVMGPTAREKYQNMLINLEAGSIAPILMMARRAA